MDYLKLISYNSTGLGGDKMDYIGNMLDNLNIDILLLQETWLLQGNLQKLNDINKNYASHGLSGVDENEILLGRPYGGLGFLWKNTLSPYVYRVPTKCNRLCAISIKCGERSILIINTYMPVDNMCKSQAAEQFVQVCDELEILINTYMDHSIIIGGDLNIDFSRGNAHDVYFRDLLYRYDLVSCWDIPCARPDYTFFSWNNNHMNTSCIDYFCFKQNLVPNVDNIYVYDCALNPSGHRPIVATITVKLETIAHKQTDQCHQTGDGIVWHKVTETNKLDYKHSLDRHLCLIQTNSVKQCNNLMCEDPGHTSAIDNWCNDLVNCCLSADHVFPRRSKRISHCKPGWNDLVKPFQKECLWWHAAWRQSGSPGVGIVYEQMRSSKRQYKYAVRRLKHHQRDIKFQKMTEAINQNQTRDFFKELKRMNSCSGDTIYINNETDPKAIADIFAKKYDSLNNSVPSDSQVMRSFSNKIKDKLKCEEHTTAQVTMEIVIEAVRKLKSEKCDGDQGLFSNHIVYATDLFFSEIASLFSSILTHGHHPELMLRSTIASIPKDAKGNLCTDSNYRGIALMSSIAKLFDIVMLMRNKDCLMTSQLQFAFKPNLGTTMCSLVVKEVLNYYIHNGARVAACFLDATKAFDRIKFDKLFELLVQRDVNPVDIRALMDLYQHQKTRTAWKGQYSNYFKCTNGIRQGAIASPTLYCIYMDVLLDRLEKDGYGCWMGNHFTGAICYADDLTLLSPSITGMQKMIQTCEEYADEFGIQYNPTKSVCVMFSKLPQRDQGAEVMLCGSRLQWVTDTKHLGNTLCSNLSESKDVITKRGDFIGRTNTLMANLHQAPDDVILPAFRSQCCHFYGCQAWNFTDNSVKEFHTAWNKGVRRVINLNRTTHRRYLPHLAKMPNSETQFFKRFLKLHQTMCCNGNMLVRYIGIMGAKNKNSIIGQNICHIKKAPKTELEREELCVIKAILDMRDQCVPGFDQKDYNEFLNFLYTN